MEIDIEKRTSSWIHNQRAEKKARIELKEREFRIERGLFQLENELNRRNIDVIYNYTRGSHKATFHFTSHFIPTITKIYDVDFRGDRAISWYGQTTAFYGIPMFFSAIRCVDYNIWAPLDELYITVSSNPEILGNKLRKIIIIS
jgi:hypothetical protein